MNFPQSMLDKLDSLVVKPAGSVYTQTVSITQSPNILLLSVKALSANSSRKGLIIYNNSANSVYLCFQGPASSAGCHKILLTFATWEVYGPCVWQGDLYAIRNAGTGQLNIVEFT